MLKLCDVSMYYQNGTNVTVGIQRINLELRKGEFVVITGESGSGKSTLLNVISSLSPYHDGEMLLNGEPTSGFDDADWEDYRRRHVGFIFQNYDLIESYTVLQNVVSAMLITGVDPGDAKKRAYRYLERVGIEDLASRRASKLSAGQKQRLTIARALAKETDIIIADEPTGNLDSKNGRQIVELLASLSEDKLVIMVSHNIEEAEEFATRMIRLKDGRIVSDTVLRSAPPMSGAQSASKPAVQPNGKPESQSDANQNPRPDAGQTVQMGGEGANDKKKTKKNGDTASEVSINDMKSQKGRARRGGMTDLGLARRLAACNSRFQPTKATIITLFMTAVCIAAFIFLGSLLSNIDDTPAKIYNSSAFLNGDNTRLLVQHKDGSPITEEDLDFFESIPNVRFVDEYGYAGDCCYHYMEGFDYQIRFIEYQTQMDTPVIFKQVPLMLKYINFIKSAKRLSPDALAEGHLPEHTNEVVLYSDDPSVLGTTMVMYFTDPVGWSTNNCVKLEMTVVGLLKEETRDMYFHENISKAFYISRTLEGGRIKAGYIGQYFENFEYYLNSSEKNGDVPTTITDINVREYDTRVFPDATLEDGTILCSYELETNWFEKSVCDGHPTVISGDAPLQNPGQGEYETTGEKVYCYSRDFEGLYGVTLSLAADEDLTYQDKYEIIYDFENDVGYPAVPDEYQFMLFKKCEIGVTGSDDARLNGSFSIIDENSFNKFMDYFGVASDQAAVYITNYAYVNDVLNALNENGEYIGISPFMISSTNYNTQKVRERFAVLILSLIALVAVFVLEIIVLFTLMRLKRDDYGILRSLGMTARVMHRMNFIELMKYNLIAVLISAVVVGALWIFDVPPLDAFTVYYRWQHVVVIILCSIASGVLLSAFFNRYLDNQFVGKRITGENGR